jgi:hypothetical protein
MKLSAFAGVGILSLLLGLPAATYAQDEPKKQEDAKPEPKQDESRPARPEDKKAPKPEEMKPSKQEESNRPSEAGRPQEHPEEAQASRPAGKSGGRIPDDKFRAHFGREHTVVINRPTVVEGQPRFQYSGYWFVISDPWPSGWAYTDQCYIDFVDGEYVLFDLAHPGVSIVLTVVM